MTKPVYKHIWYDLMTPDLKAAEKFYASVIGWKIADAGMPGMAYSILNAGDTMVGGMMQVPKGDEGMQNPPRWHGHIYVPDVDGYAKRVTAAGGEICRQPADIPGIGRFAVVADPQGASFIMFKPNSTEQPKPVPPNTPGHIGWHELHAGDGITAWEFYSSLFGWTKDRDLDMGQLGIYRIFATGGEATGGMMTRMPDTPAPTWLYYFEVDAIDAAAARATAAGGKIVMGPHQVPTGQWIVQCTDPQGAAFAMVSFKR
jgi:predicted enzyme related to lactoylglutathione lyase